MDIYRSVQRPIERNAIRQKLGVAYFTLKKHMQWMFGGMKFGKISDARLGHEYFARQTPLLRHLKGVDIQLEQNKVTNLHIAVAKMHGVIIYPGETLSFWRAIGKPTRHKGYLNGVILRRGAFGEGLGGGLCHLSGMLYWATLHTPLTVSERHRHGYDTTPDKLFGSDATCFYNYKDVMIKNNTAQPFQLMLDVGENHLRVAWMSDAPPVFTYEIYQKEHLVHKEDWGGYTRHNHLHRKVFDIGGTQVGDEFVAENHAIMMYPPEES